CVAWDTPGKLGKTAHTSVHIATREAEQAAWGEQKQLDLQALHSEHNDAVQILEREHAAMRAARQEASETLHMGLEDKWMHCVGECTRLQETMGLAIDIQIDALQGREGQRDKAEQDHVHALAQRQLEWDQALGAWDAAATAESVQHARFMKQVVQTHGKNLQAMRDETASLEVARVAKEATMATQIEEWHVKLDQLQADAETRLRRMVDCHNNILRDLDVAFESQQEKRRQEYAALNAALHAKWVDLDCRHLESLAAYAMEIEDLQSRHAWQLTDMANVQVDLTQTTESSVVQAYAEQFEAKQVELEANVAKLRVKHSDIERFEVEKHKQANQSHLLCMAERRHAAQETLEGLLAQVEDGQSRAVATAAMLQRQHDTYIERWRESVERKRLAIEDDQEHIRRAQATILEHIRSNLDEVCFAHAATCTDITALHERQLADLRLQHAQAEETWMQKCEDCIRRQEWAQNDVENQCAETAVECAVAIESLKQQHDEWLVEAAKTLPAADQAHARWCMAFEEASTREFLAAEATVEAQWTDIQRELNHREKGLQRRVTEMQHRMDDDVHRHHAALHAIQEGWMERLTGLHMQREDVYSTYMAQVATLDAAHATAMEVIAGQLTHHERTSSDEKARSQRGLDVAREATICLSENQQAFFDEAAAAIGIKWQEVETQHEAKAATETA
ncbi:hypothetical protein As57867_020843, partial [Aphanomyces stellatus]